MALPRRQQRLLVAIDQQMNSTDPRLAWLFGTFGRLWAGEPLPAREQLRTRAGRFCAALWDALGAVAWPVPPLVDTLMTGATGEASAGSGSLRAVPGRAEQAPGVSERNGRGRSRGTG